MSHLKVQEKILADAMPEQESPSCCSTGTLVKVGFVVFALLLGGGALAAHLCHVNAIAVYTMGGCGGLIILGTAITSIVQCIRNRCQTTEQPTREESSPISQPKSQAPESVTSKLPLWLAIDLKDIPYQKLENDTGFYDLNDRTEPLILFSNDATVGMHMRLRVNHINIDSTYDRSSDKPLSEFLQGSTRDSFISHAIAWMPTTGSDKWMLTADNEDYIEHRNRHYCIGSILEEDYYECHSSDPLTQDTIDLFLNTEQDDALPSKYQNHLGWILLRLLKTGHFTLRERRTDRLLNSMKDPVVGYWQISLDR